MSPCYICSSSSQDDSPGILMPTCGRMIPRQSIWLLIRVLRRSVVLVAIELPLALTCGCDYAWWGSVTALPFWMLPLFDFSIWVSLHFLIIFVVTVPFRRYCPSLPAFSIPMAGCGKSNTENSRLRWWGAQPFPLLCSWAHLIGKVILLCF